MGVILGSRYRDRPFAQCFILILIEFLNWKLALKLYHRILRRFDWLSLLRKRRFRQFSLLFDVFFSFDLEILLSHCLGGSEFDKNLFEFFRNASSGPGVSNGKTNELFIR